MECARCVGDCQPAAEDAVRGAVRPVLWPKMLPAKIRFNTFNLLSMVCDCGMVLYKKKTGHTPQRMFHSDVCAVYQFN